jgi:hypothetical protein
MEENYLDDTGSMKRRSIEHLNNIPEGDFWERLEVWKTRLEECFRANEVYFEGTKVRIASFNFYRYTVPYGIYIFFTHQHMHFY